VSPQAPATALQNAGALKSIGSVADQRPALPTFRAKPIRAGFFRHWQWGQRYCLPVKIISRSGTSEPQQSHFSRITHALQVATGGGFNAIGAIEFGAFGLGQFAAGVGSGKFVITFPTGNEKHIE
jgi:hypothetical protein